MRRASRTALAVVPLLVGGLLVGVGAAGPAVADEVYPRPASGVYEVAGHGWGHGHGMSQWGAEGAAVNGVSAATILATYYPHTTSASLPDAPIRVLLSGADPGTVTVYAAQGLAAEDLASGVGATLPSGPTQWRVTVDKAALHVQGRTASGWTTYALKDDKGTSHNDFRGPVRFSGPTFVRLVYPDNSSRDYRGSVQAVRSGDTTLATVDVLRLEDYLLGVVPRESSSSWQPAALQAQAVAARSYSAWKREHAPGSQAWDICDSTWCQVFGGSRLYAPDGSSTPLETAATTAAVQATEGVVREYGGHPIFAEFGSSNGGWSTDGGQPYLVAQRDDWDGAVRNPVHSWSGSLPVSAIEARYPRVGHLAELRVTKRDGNGEWGGRVLQVVLVGSGGSVTTTGTGIYLADSWPGSSDGLRSNWWHITPTTAAAVSSQSTPPVLVRSPGASSATLTAVLRNTGTTSWPVSGLHLVVASPPGQADPLAGGSTAPGRFDADLTRPGAAEVEPGDLARFRVLVDGDGVPPGVAARAYRVQVGDGPVFGDPVQWLVRVDAPLFTARPAGLPLPAVVVPRRGTATVAVRLTDTGNVAWPGGSGSPVRLGGAAPERDVSAGGTGLFRVALAGGGAPLGVTRVTLQPVWQGRHTLTGGAVPLTEVLVDPTVPRLAGLELAPPASVSATDAPGVGPTLVVRLRNLGGSSWTVGRDRLAASAPYALSGPGWTSATAPPPLAVDLSRPGAAAVAPGEVGEWRVPLTAVGQRPGDYPLQLQAVVPGGGGYGPLLRTVVRVRHAVVTGTVTALGPAVALPRHGTATTWFDVRNTGNTPWPVAGAVRSTALSGGPSGSPSRATAWLTPRRPGAVSANLSAPGAATVLPGQVARFLVVLAGNGRSGGSYRETFGIVWEAFAPTPLRAVLPYTLTP